MERDQSWHDKIIQSKDTQTGYAGAIPMWHN